MKEMKRPSLRLFEGLEHFYTSHSNYNDNYINKNELCSSQFLNATASLQYLGVNGDLNPDLHDVDAVLHDLIHQGNSCYYS